MPEKPTKVLLIQNDPDVAELVWSALTESDRGDFELDHAGSLKEGVMRLNSAGRDVILLDLRLPDARGAEAFDAVYRRWAEVPILLLIDLADEALALDLIKRGAQEYLFRGDLDGNLLVRCIRHAMERHRLIRQLQALSLVDDLTGLHNRRGFLSLAYQQQRHADRTGRPFYVLFVDLDDMKWINDKLGHQMGDQALMDMASVLEGTFRDSDIIARVGGDEFVALLPDVEELDIEALQARLEQNLRKHSLEKDRPYELRASVGVTMYEPRTATSIDDLIDRADKLMYRHKRKRKAS